MKIYYSDLYSFSLPANHRFPIEKYRMLRDFLLANKVVYPEHLLESPLATENELILAHSFNYVQSMQTGTVDPQIIKRIGFPWSYELYLRSCASVGGTIAAAKAALQDGIAGNLAGVVFAV
jgi:acetoin utilization deacetylase AcuC-like enzyme